MTDWNLSPDRGILPRAIWNDESERTLLIARRREMAIYIILSRISPEAFATTKQFKDMSSSVTKRIQSECPGVHWKESFSTLGRFDVVDIVEADDPKEVEKVTMIFRAYGNLSTETLLATPWKDFLKVL
jgi:uncharacterized protein with GYD domain